MRLLFFILVFSKFCLQIQAQQGLNGAVVDPDGNPLAFVTVLINAEPGKGVLTDIEGRFHIDAGLTISALGFRYVGYKPRRIEADFWEKTPGKPFVVVLQAADYALPEATVRAGENPADILIRKAIARRKENNPERLASYTCKTYNKIMFEAVPRRDVFEKEYAGKDTALTNVREAIEGFNKLEKAMQARHAFLMESVTERAFLFPDQVQEKVLLNRVSGFKNAALVALANTIQPFSFYGDYLTILDKNFVNPISPGSPNLYFFHIEDTLYSGPDTVWVIAFHPRKNKVFEGLEGVIHLHSRGWAIQNVRARPAIPGNLEITIEQAFAMVNGGQSASTVQWFPEQLNFELEFKKYPAHYAGARAAGRSYIREVQIEPPLRPRDFNAEMPVLMRPEADDQTDSSWQRWRMLAPLSNKEIQTYQWLDSLGETKHFDRLSKVMDIAATGRVPIAGSVVAIDLTQVLKLNEYERYRLGFGLTTAQTRPLLPQRRLELSAYIGYGFRDKAWKFGGQALWRITAAGHLQLRAGWRRDLMEPGTSYELLSAALVNRSLYAKRMDQVDEIYTALSSRLGRYFTLRGTFRKQNLTPGYPYQYGKPDAGYASRFDFTEGTIFLRYANGERSSQFFGSDVGTTQRLPVLELAYTRGQWKPGLSSGKAAPYERWTAALYQSFFLGRLGRTRWRVEAGWATADAPMAKLFTLNQTGGGFNIFVLPNTFQALPDTLFLADRFVNFYFAQEFGPVLYQSKYSAPALSLLQNAAWGDLRRPEGHLDQGFRTAATVLLESGLQLDKLLRINYYNFAHFGLGGAIFYRWGGLQADKWSDNLSFRATLRMEL